MEPGRFTHSRGGEFTLTRNNRDNRDNRAIDGPNALRLVIYHAVAGSEDHDRLVPLRDARPRTKAPAPAALDPTTVFSPAGSEEGQGSAGHVQPARVDKHVNPLVDNR